MGNSLSRGTLDVIYILFPFVLSAGLIITIVVCWWKCKRCIDKRRPGKAHRMEYPDEPDFGHLINIQEYAENQVGTTIVYADSPGSTCPHPYVYFSDGRITRIVPLIPSPTYSNVQHHDHSHSSCPSTLLCNNLARNNNMRGGGHHRPCQQNNHNNYRPNFHGLVHLHPSNNHQEIVQQGNNLRGRDEPDSEVQCVVTTTPATTSANLTPESRDDEGVVVVPIDDTGATTGEDSSKSSALNELAKVADNNNAKNTPSIEDLPREVVEASPSLPAAL